MDNSVSTNRGGQQIPAVTVSSPDERQVTPLVYVYLQLVDNNTVTTLTNGCISFASSGAGRDRREELHSFASSEESFLSFPTLVQKRQHAEEVEELF